MEHAAITISEDYLWVLLAATVIAVQILTIGFAVGSVRKKHHVDYPDMGSGIYAAKLNHAAWIEFNNYQRAHYNYVEGIATVLTLLLIAGVFYPQFSAAVGLVYIIGRQLYARGYQTSGSEGRKLGVGLVDLSLVVLLGTILYSILPILYHKVA